MIQDIAPHRLDNHYVPGRQPEKDDFVIYYKNRKMLVCIDKEQRTLIFPKISEIKDIIGKNTVEKSKELTNRNIEDYVYLFDIDGRGFFLCSGEESVDKRMGLSPMMLSQDVQGFREVEDVLFSTEEGDFYYVDMNQIRAYQLSPQEYVYAAFSAMHLAEWYQSKRFCGCCGQPLHRDAVERAMVCDRCQRKFYPRINPAVIVGVIHEDHLLITRYRQGYRHNALIAGFTEIGETLEETVIREVAEETGIRVKNIRYYKSQPWGVSGDILAGFFCEAEGDTQIHMDSDELKYAQWVKREEIRLQPADYSLTNEMMKVFREGNGKFYLSL